MPYTYMVRCRDGSLYTGYTTDLERRINTHNSGRGAKYTKSRLPVVLVWRQYCEETRQARRLECAVKKLTRKQKECLIQNPKRVYEFCATVWREENGKS